MNKELIHNRFAKNLKNYNENAKIQKRMAERLMTFIQNKQPKKKPKSGLIIHLFGEKLCF